MADTALLPRIAGPFDPFLRAQGVVVLDGGLATELEAQGVDLSGGLWSARLLLEEPRVIRTVHEIYLRAGADCLISATYQATVEGFGRYGVPAADAERLMAEGVGLACAARDAFWGDPRSQDGRLRPLVAASIGPYGAYRADGSEYTGDYDRDQAGLEDFHRRRLALLAGAGADLLACETIPSAAEARALAHLLETLPPGSPPAWISFTCRDAEHLSDGSRLDDLVRELSACPSIVALGVNCVPPSRVPALVAGLRAATDRAIVAYPNSGESWDAHSKAWRGTAEPLDFANRAAEWVAAGAVAVGGCCRTRPEHIRSLRMALLARQRFGSSLSLVLPP